MVSGRYFTSALQPESNEGELRVLFLQAISLNKPNSSENNNNNRTNSSGRNRRGKKASPKCIPLVLTIVTDTVNNLKKKIERITARYNYPDRNECKQLTF